MARGIAVVGTLIGLFAVAVGLFWITQPPEETFVLPLAVGLVVFGCVVVYSGVSILRSGRL